MYGYKPKADAPYPWLTTVESGDTTFETPYPVIYDEFFSF